MENLTPAAGLTTESNTSNPVVLDITLNSKEKTLIVNNSTITLNNNQELKLRVTIDKLSSYSYFCVLVFDDIATDPLNLDQPVQYIKGTDNNQYGVGDVHRGSGNYPYFIVIRYGGDWYSLDPTIKVNS